MSDSGRNNLYLLTIKTIKNENTKFEFNWDH